MRVIPVLPVDFMIRFPIGRLLMTSFFLILPRHAYFPVYGGAVRSNGTHRDDDSLPPDQRSPSAEDQL